MHAHTLALTNITKEHKPGSVVTITGTYSKAHLEKERAHTIALLRTQVHVDGFRPGAVPETMLVAQLGETYIQEKTAEHALEHDLQQILITHNVLPIVPPHINVRVTDDGNALVTITTTTYPSVTLGDYKKIATDVMSGATDVHVKEDEVIEALTHFRRERLRIDDIEAARNANDTLSTSHDAILKKAAETAVENLPPLDDAFVKQIGFDSVAAFEEHIRKELHAGKTQQARSERRAAILKKICEKPVADVPEPLVEYELAKMEASLAEYLAQAGQTLETYFEKTNKTRTDIHTEWRSDALVRAQHQLALIEIAKREGIHEHEKELASLIEETLRRNPTAERQAVHSHYQVLLRNEAVMQWLESQK